MIKEDAMAVLTQEIVRDPLPDVASDIHEQTPAAPLFDHLEDDLENTQAEQEPGKDSSLANPAESLAAELLVTEPLSERFPQVLAQLVGPKRYDTWFGQRIQFAFPGQDQLEIHVSSSLEKECLQSQFREDIDAACRTVFAGKSNTRDKVRVQYVVGKPANGTADATEVVAASTTATLPAAADKPPKRNDQELPQPQPMQQQTLFPIDTPQKQLSKRRSTQPATSPSQKLTLQRFMVGESNREAALMAAQIIAGGCQGTPILLWGQTGVGKSHLLSAIRDEARRRQPRARIVSLTAEQFTTDFVEAIHGRGANSFRNKHRNVDLWLLDDLHFIAGKEKTVEELQHTIDSLLATEARVVITSDRSPQQLQKLGGDLVSRLSAGMAIEIAAPEQTLRAKLVQQLAHDRGLFIDAETTGVVATGVIGGARELSGVLNRIELVQQLLGEPIDAVMAQQAVDEVNRHSTPQVQMVDIQNAICRVFGVDASTLKGKKRTKASTEPRMLAMWLSRKYTRSAWSEIGDYYGRRSHSTVISACQRVDTLMTRTATVSLNGNSCDLRDALRRVEAELRTA